MNAWEDLRYLGDDVYVSCKPGAYIKLMTNDYIQPENIIYLDESTFKKLLEFVKVHAEAWLREE